MGSRAVVVRQGWERFVGTEATRTNHMVTAGASVVGTVGAVVLARSRGGGVGVATTVAVLALDLVGGAYVNNTRASARWYEREGQGEAEHLTFAALHAHPLLVAVVDHRVDARDRWAGWASPSTDTCSCPRCSSGPSPHTGGAWARD